MKFSRRDFLKVSLAGLAAAILAAVFHSRAFRLLEPSLPAEAVEGVRKRLPPGQYETGGLPVLHAGSVPKIDAGAWRLAVSGLVENPLELSLAEVKGLSATKVTVDIHCVTKWSRLGAVWEGVSFKEIAGLVKPKEGARFVVFETAQDGWTTSLPLPELMKDDVLLAYSYDGRELTPEHGRPLRMVVPQKYFYKSAKWVTGIRFIERDEPGFWERRGYSNTADPWTEDRYS